MTKHNSGVSLIAVVVAVAIVSIAAFIFMQMTGTFIFAGARLDKSLKGQQVLVGVASELQRQDFDSLLGDTDICSPLSGTPPKKTTYSTLRCLVSGALTTNVTPPAPGKPSLGVLLNENGKVGTDGDTCVEVTQCRLIADGNMLELNLMAYWKNSDPSKSVLSKNTVLRRARW